MEFAGIRVLVLDAAGKQTLAMVRGLKEIGCHVTVLCRSRLDVCYASRLPDRKLLVPEADPRSEEYIPELLRIVSSGEYDVLMPVGELSTNPVTKHEEEFRNYVRLACAPRAAYLNAYDKQRTFDLAAQAGVSIPVTRSQSQTVEDFLGTVSFPLIIKPRNGLGSIGFHRFDRPEDFWPYIEEHKIDLNEYVLQECVDHEERIGTILFMDQHGNVCMAYADEVLRWFPIDAGTACLIRSIDHPEAIRWSSDLLKAMKWQGIAALSFMVDKKTGVPKLQEVNGRIPASVRLSSQCGFNVAKLLIELAYDEKVEQYPVNTRFGLCTRHLDLDLAWFMKSPDRFRAEPSWFSWKNTKEVLYNRDDRKPFFAHFFQQISQYRAIMKKKHH